MINDDMNYSIAKELQDAGFPQGGKGTWVTPLDKIVVRAEDRVYSPTLEELIEACGKSFVGLTASDDDSGDWSAFATGYPVGVIEGKSPSEAVARLWLVLHRKP
jgi:hypothetical protein